MVKVKKLISDSEHDMTMFEDDAFDFKKHVGPALEHSIKHLHDTVKWGDLTTSLLVNAKDVVHAFEGNAESAAHLQRKFPSSYKQLMSLNQQMKILKFDLANTVTDVQNLASSTETNSARGLRKLQLR